MSKGTWNIMTLTNKRPKGRQRKTWLNSLKEVGKRKNLSEGEMKNYRRIGRNGDSSVEAPEATGKKREEKEEENLSKFEKLTFYLRIKTSKHLFNT